MKRFILFQLFFFLALGLWAQTDTDLLTFNEIRLQKQQTAMTILGSWAVGNMIVGGVLVGRAEGPEKYFHQMNIGWNAVNLTLAGFGLYGALTTDPGSFDLFQTIQEQHRFQKILLFNAGLDVGYVLGGAYLLERSRRHTGMQADRLEGFGKSIMLQGGFLFAFDLIAFFAMSAENPEVRDLLGGLQWHGNGLSWTYRF